MDTQELAKIDLNLLIALQILLEEKNVSRAAERLYITQPAMSKTLSRLRLVFDDPLFTRSSHGMQPTPRATGLASELAEILGSITHLVTGDHFDPATFDGEIKIALSEYLGVALLPPLVQRLQDHAPRLSLSVITRVENQLQALANGNLDYALHIRQSTYGDEFRVQDLGSSPPAILVRDSHPLAEGEINWQRLAQYPLIRLYVSDWEQAELQRNAGAYAGIPGHQRGSLEISHLLTALEVLRNSEYFMPGPAYILQNEGATSGITALPVPDGSMYELNYVLVTHKRTASSPIHHWLWEQITCTIRNLQTPQLRKIRKRISAVSRDPVTEETGSQAR
jgi:DNA-binding transcriptional LysR family regulator